MITKRTALNQLHSLRHTGLDQLIMTALKIHNLEPAYVFAVASRETNCLNILGDFRNGEFHGVGLLQVDIQHTIARAMRDDGTWKSHPQAVITFGVNLLATNVGQAKHHLPDRSRAAWLKVAASGYNCGMGNALKGSENGDSDRLTTGKDYGRDVLYRMGLFAELLEEGE